nr:GGDEF domain-containing protein [Bradyrhizobium sp. 159]
MHAFRTRSPRRLANRALCCIPWCSSNHSQAAVAASPPLDHQAGDACLQRVAEVIGSATANTGGLSARYGDEEFAVVLPGVDEKKAIKVADAIRLLVRRLEIYHPRASRDHVSISIGLAEKSDGTINELALTRDADIALYHAKEQGRDCTVASSSLVSSRLQMPSLVPSLADLRDASVSRHDYGRHHP